MTVVVVYPELMGTYGDGGNALALTARCTRRGLRAEVLAVHAPDAVPRTADVHLIGGAENASQTTASQLLRAEGGLRAAVGKGATVLGICGGYQVLGECVTDAEGVRTDGLGLLDVRSAPLPRRAVGDIAINPYDQTLPTLVGFENHAYGTTVGPDATPFAAVYGGVGNGAPQPAATERTEGAVQGGGRSLSGLVLGTYLHGPLLALNPALADQLLLVPFLGPLEPLEDPVAAEVRRLRRPVIDARRERLRGRTWTGWLSARG